MSCVRASVHMFAPQSTFAPNQIHRRMWVEWSRTRGIETWHGTWVQRYEKKWRTWNYYSSSSQSFNFHSNTLVSVQDMIILWSLLPMCIHMGIHENAKYSVSRAIIDCWPRNLNQNDENSIVNSILENKPGWPTSWECWKNAFILHKYVQNIRFQHAQ